MRGMEVGREVTIRVNGRELNPEWTEIRAENLLVFPILMAASAIGKVPCLLTCGYLTVL